MTNYKTNLKIDIDFFGNYNIQKCYDDYELCHFLFYRSLEITSDSNRTKYTFSNLAIRIAIDFFLPFEEFRKRIENGLEENLHKHMNTYWKVYLDAHDM